MILSILRSCGFPSFGSFLILEFVAIRIIGVKGLRVWELDIVFLPSNYRYNKKNRAVSYQMEAISGVTRTAIKFRQMF